MADRDERIGWWVSGGVHGALLVALILGGALFRPQPGPGTRSTQVSTISGAEFEALAAAARGSGPVGANATDIDQMANPAEPEAEAVRPVPASPPATDDAAELSAPDRSESAPDLSDFEPRDPVAVTTDLRDPTAPATAEALPDLPRATDAPQAGRSAAVPVAPAPDQVAEPVAPRSALALDRSRNPQSRPDGLVEAYRQRQAEAAAAEAAAAAQREAAAEAARAEAARAEAARAKAAQQAADAQAEAQAEAREQAEAEAQRRAAAEEAEAREAAEAAEARQRAEEERQAAEAERRAEEERRAAEAAQAERRAEEAAEAERRAEAERQAAEAERRAEEERRAAEAAEAAEEERRAEAERRAEEERRAEAERRAEEERRAAEAAEAERRAEEERRAAEAAEAERRAEEERRAAEAAEADRQALEDALREAQGAGGGADGTDTAAGADAFGDSQSIEGGSGASAEMDPLAAALAGAMSAGSGTEDAGSAAPAPAPNQLVPGDIRPSTLPDPSQQGALPLGDPLSQSERDGLRFAIHDCWNKGLLSVEASQMTVSVGVRLSPEGIPEQDSLRMAGYRGGSEGAAQQAFEIASRAILMCGRAGFELPMSKYGRWRDIVVDFRPDGVEF